MSIHTAEQLFELLDETGKPITLDASGQLTGDMSSDMIPLKDWAKQWGISPATARQKALRGSFRTARKVGRDWMISASESNPDCRRKIAQVQRPMLEGPVWFEKVMHYLLALNGNRLPDHWTKANEHKDYCARIFGAFCDKFHGNERRLMDLLCDVLEQQKLQTVCYVPHKEIMSRLEDEAWYTTSGDSTMNSGVTIDFEDYLVLLKNTVRELMAQPVELKIHHGTQELFMPWYHSITWMEEADDGLYFVPSDFFKTILLGLE
ncbi:hypothetical protein SAMN05216391_11734 [Lachnospiraceae bacterium KHCPX20]|nr:hypothetical protein SAMN05216391_11734 [Lachnospiraceae bacterium KHCPX20]